MTAVIPRATRARILQDVAASDGSRRALDQVASAHGLMLHELKHLVAVSNRPSASTRPGNPTPSETHRTCSICDVRKPIAEFYVNAQSRGGRMAHCATCNNARRPTPTRMVRNRARGRALKLLAQQHSAEFDRLYAEQLTAATTEHERLQTAAAGNTDAQVARLRPGPARQGETKVDRLDVARCTTCHTHHDAAHECPTCGDTTPVVAPTVRPWVIREWAVVQGMAPVPARGPLPDRIIAAFHDAHAELSKAVSR